MSLKIIVQKKQFWVQKGFFLLNLFFAFFSNTTQAQFVRVDDTYSAQQLIQNVLVNSPCANVTNIQATGNPFNTNELSYGYFDANGSSFPFLNGVVLSTARAKRSEGPNTSLIDEGETGWQGDPDLEQALGISNTFNATVIEFDFTPLTSYVSFDYIFASEEYQGNAPCRYSDGFAFLLKRANSTENYRNLALIPNTNTPVLVTSVHPTTSGCPAINEQYFGQYNGNSDAVNFNGQTTVLKAESTVTPGVTYHIKLVIADHENIRYDSAIFLGGGSFKVGTDLGPDRLIASNNPICQGQSYQLDATEVGTNSYKWFKNGIEQIGFTAPIFNVTSDGIYSVEVSLGSSGCISSGEVTIEYIPGPNLSPSTLVQCDENQDGSALFNLNLANTLIINGNPGTVTYYENLNDAQNQNTTQSIPDPSAYESVPKTIYATALSSAGCVGVTQLSLQISNNSLPSEIDYETCDLDSDKDGYYGITLAQIDTDVLSGLPSGLVVQYYPTYQDALLQTNALPAVFTNTVRYEQTIFAKIINGSDCYGIVPVKLFINKNEPDNFEDEPVFLCYGQPITISVANTFATYLWSNGATGSSTQISSPGLYTVTVTDANTCEATKTFIADGSEAPTITNVLVDDFQGNQNSVHIIAEGNGNFEYSIDGNTFQNSAVFYGLQPGNYSAVANDINGCGFDTYAFIILDYPRFFTPNDDGYNDVWNIENLNIIPNAKVEIFDRYGKNLFEFNALQRGWDGNYNGKKLPADDYWFVLTRTTGKTIKGHFALKR
ncbi:choice-of-anchor L domain-containing protein [Flavobacterium sp. CYK-55]|uniref:T9SS type B sorting domain-containing protein n=1 Tax=Flavobacterium sp. CYK-55 TaxID=2835529 RepID=UPI001BCB7AA9|nr:choice-of-anchor L domain-containing protein [Flavobacterium sp. CYK-55]MBS7786238.1 choice-of-anchor L domain-containing protein [Flavobacterium sp. CYK-55]